MIRLGTNQDSFCRRGGGFPPFEEMMQGVADMGLTLFEFCPEYVEQAPDLLTPGRRKEARKLADSLGLKLAIHASYGSLNICFMNRYTRAESIRQLKREIELAHDLESDIITVHPGAPMGLAPWYSVEHFWWPMMLDSYAELVRHAEPLGVRITTENINNWFVGSKESLTRLYADLDSPNFGLTFDFGHHNLIYSDLPLQQRTAAMLDIFESLGSRIWMLHVHDNNGVHDDHIGLGKGEIDFATAFPALMEHEIQAYWSMELTNRVDVNLSKARIDEFLEA